MKTLLNSVLKKRFTKRRSPLAIPNSGFTLIELLVATIVATIIIVPILSFVVNILNTDVREQAKTNSEQELQAAIDYIAQDMSQAFYIYTPDEVRCLQNRNADSCGTVPETTGAPAIPTDVGTPTIVFWKRKYEKDALPVDDCTVTDTNDCRDDTFVYSLVAYYEIEGTSTSTASVWCDEAPCPSRIARVEISDNPTDSLGNYLEGAPNNGYNTANISNRETPRELVKGDGNFDSVRVLVNYIRDFELNSVDNNELAKITIQGNALRRIQTNNTDCSDSSYCPKATAQVGRRSGFGQ
ncbi:MAG: type II secretion system protein [Okeania sp. SIO3I5]|uniref:prepilin-type N-terminal cleavage/methylation domain-containing protein n=1 Tax=Okeania sp. SIO3I5 TaxID=2607805 RepID=UPI0013B7A8C6|nr:prepilin-type N-terminal cleavage/methylation domain-containing protein [Okeania sp. SIO3I5]NEQ39110.1 type II secretion system protein [Okeania sp. SIO3I5]